MSVYTQLTAKELLRVAPGKTGLSKPEYEHQRAAFTHYIRENRSDEDSPYNDAAVQFVQNTVRTDNRGDITHDDAAELLRALGSDRENEIPFPVPENPKFTFIDLFAGIGGFRIAMQGAGGLSVFSSDVDSKAKKTYETNFGEMPFGDITLEKTKSCIPDRFDVLCGGFPCQAFSIAGRKGGFEDTRGTLFFEVAKIIKAKRPKAVFLENVKGLLMHDKGKTLATILNVLRNDLGYFVPDPEIVNAKNFGVPQKRERIFIAGFRKDLGIADFEYPKPINKQIAVKDIVEKVPISVKYYLSDTYLNTLRAHRARHEGKGNGFGFEIIPSDGTANAVVCGGMGRERNLIQDDGPEDYTPVTNIKGKVNREGIRKMTPREWARLQGFPDHFIIPVADASAYRQFGNSVAVPAVRAMADKILEKIL